VDYNKIDKDINYTEVSRAQYMEFLFGGEYKREVDFDNIVYKDKDGFVMAVYRIKENECYIPHWEIV
jgi:hypothetical protein